MDETELDAPPTAFEIVLPAGVSVAEFVAEVEAYAADWDAKREAAGFSFAPLPGARPLRLGSRASMRRQMLRHFAMFRAAAARRFAQTRAPAPRPGAPNGSAKP